MSTIESFLTKIIHNVPFYSGIKLQSGDPSSGLDNLRQFPIINKKIIFDSYENFFSTKVREFVKLQTIGLHTPIHQSNMANVLIPEVTSGSSGTPLKIYKTNEERIKLGIAMWKLRNKIDRTVNSNNLFCLIHSHASQKKIVDDLRNYSDANIEKVLITLRDTIRPKAIHGSPSDLMRYANFIVRSQFDFRDWKLSFIESNSETLLAETRSAIAKAFDTRVINNYGTLETWNIAYECSYGHMHISNNIIVEVEPVEAIGNGFGKLLVTNLLLESFPIIRYEIGDLGKVTKSSCKCGSQNPILELYEARQINLIHQFQNQKKAVNGVSLFKAVIWDILVAIDLSIERYRVIQETPKNFNVFVTMEENQFNLFKENFAQFAKKRMEQEAEFDFQLVPHDSTVYSGKDYSFLCKVVYE